MAIITGDSGNNVLQGDFEDDTIYGLEGNDTLIGGKGHDTLLGGADFDIADYSSAPFGVIAELWKNTASNDGYFNTDVFDSIEYLIGSAQSDILAGNDEDNFFVGNAGDDFLFGGGGSDKLYGSAGTDFLDGGDGVFDEVSYTSSPNGVIVELWRNLASNDGYGSSDTLYGFELLEGSSSGDILAGNDLDNRILGWDGDDVIYGGGGNDRLEGGKGVDFLVGGDGTDEASFTNAANGVIVELWKNSATNDGYGNIEALIGIENVVGSQFADVLAGDDGANSLSGREENDSIFGGGGNDILDGGKGTDFLFGGDGDDSLNAGKGGGGEILHGGQGIDSVGYSDVTGLVVELWRNTATSTGRVADTLIEIENVYGSNSDDIIAGNDGGNSLFGNEGNDSIYGGGGNDFLDGGKGTDFLFGGDGDDHLSAGKGGGGEFLHGGQGLDTVSYSSVTGLVVELWRSTATSTGRIADTLVEIENVNGTGSDDVIAGNDGTNNLIGNDGIDLIFGGGGNDFLDGGLGTDSLYAGDGDDTLNAGGNGGGDILHGGNGIDTAYFGGVTRGVAGLVVELWRNAATSTGGIAETLVDIENVTGSFSDDIIAGNDGANTLDGSDGSDLIFGGGGADYLLGGKGNDNLQGGDGADVILGGKGNDYLVGGKGGDIFEFSTAPNVLAVSELGIDSIADFSIVDDTIGLENASFTALTATGALASTSFRSGSGITTAGDSDDYLIYDTATGALYYDGDGTGLSATPIQFATLVGAPALTAGDFTVI